MLKTQSLLAVSRQMTMNDIQAQTARLQVQLNKLADINFPLGEALYREGKYNAAVDRFREVLALKKDGDADILNWLRDEFETGRTIRRSRATIQTCLKNDMETLGNDHPATADHPQQSCTTLSGARAIPRSRTLYVEVLRIAEEGRWSRRSGIAPGLNNLADLYREQGRFSDAQTLYKQALDINEER